MVLTGTGAGPAKGPDATAVWLVERLVTGLNAYRQEFQLYPSDHPRVQNRLSQLHEDLATFMERRKKIFVVQVREGTLYSANRPLPRTSGAVDRLAAFLRERMIQLIQLSPGVTDEEIQRFVAILLRDPEELTGELRQSTKVGTNLTLYHFHPFFGEDEAVTEEEIIAGANEYSALLGEVATADSGRSRWSASDWITFDREQLHAIARVVRVEPLKSRIEEVRRAHGLDRGGRDFLPSFLEVLRRDPRTDWQNLDGLRDLILAGLRLVVLAASSLQESGEIPDGLVMSRGAAADLLHTHARWRLIHTFFPGLYQQRAAIEEGLPAEPPPAPPGGDHDPEDFDWQNKGGGWSLSDLPEEEWGRTDPETLRDHYARQFDGASLLAECAAVLEELSRLQPDLRTPRLRRNLIERLGKDLSRQGDSAEQVERLLTGLEGLTAEGRRSWRTDLLGEFSPPGELLDEICAGDQERREALLRFPPEDLEREIEGEEFLPEAQEAIRRLLRRRDEYALQLSFEILLCACDAGTEPRWLRLVRATCADNPRLGTWAEGHVELLLRTDAAEYLLAVLDDVMLEKLEEHLRLAGAHHLLPVLRAIGGRTEPAAGRLARLALRLGPTVRVAAIQTLGQQPDGAALGTLTRLLEEQNSGKPEAAEVNALVTAIGRHGEGVEFLRQLLTDRNAVGLHRWKRPIRLAARAAVDGAAIERTHS